MESIFLGIVIFLCVLAIFDLVVGVSNDAVNFINSAIGAKAASFRTIIIIAAIGVFAGAAMSNGMMDVARHGIFTPQYFTFYEVMCIFLAVMVTDVVLLDIFNSLGMPTSTTVSMVFELLGGAFALSLVKMVHGETMADGTLLTLGDLLNTDKALSVIMAIFMSVAVAFVFGLLVMWLSRLIFSFIKPQNRSVKTILFGGLSATAIIWFLLINGLKGSSFMTADVKAMINENTWAILGICLVTMSALMAVLSFVRVNILKVVVLMGTFALAMAFAGNDLVNFVGVPLTGLDAYQDYMANGQAQGVDGFLMSSLQDSAHTPVYFLFAAGVVMVLSLIFSKKAQNVVKTSVDLSRQDEGDEMFGSSAVARSIVRSSQKISDFISPIIPDSLKAWVNNRFNNEVITPLPSREGQGEGLPAFDMVRASVNLVLAGLLVALGTSFKLPLSTTYVTFMVAMGASLADRAWSRESAVFRITGVLSVIGGWFITAGVAFILCYLVTNAMYFGSYVVMGIAIVIAIVMLIRSNLKYKEKDVDEEEKLFRQIIRSKDTKQTWLLLCQHIRMGNAKRVAFVMKSYRQCTDAFLNEKYRPLRHCSAAIDEERKTMKRQRRREIIALRRIDPLQAMQRNTWYYLGINSVQQMLYCMKRINDPLREHIGNNFSPLPLAYHERFIDTRNSIVNLFEETLLMIQTGDFTDAEMLREKCQDAQRQISNDRKKVLDTLQDEKQNINTQLLTVHLLQESQELLGSLRHLIRGMNKFAGADA
mgnify:CR=1 FL=1